MMNFKTRSYKAELLDNDDIPTADLFQNLIELEFINTYLGGHKVVISAISKLIGNNKIHTQPIKIVEIGSGGGDNLRAIYRWGQKNNIPLKLIGIDLKKDCIDFSVNNSKDTDIQYIKSDYSTVQFTETEKPDIIFNSLFCHHFTDEQLFDMTKWMGNNATKGYAICDLHRHPLAYFSIKFLTAIFSKSYLVKNDAPLSVLRGFKKSDLLKLLNKIDRNSYTINWKWAFRWQVLVKLH